MSARESPQNRFEARRHKERVAFLVVKFLRVHEAFSGIAAEFAAQSTGTAEALGGSGLFEKVRELTGGTAFDLKEIAHSLFRSQPPAGPQPAGRGKRQLLAGRKSSIERLSLDSYIGTCFHLLLILQESLYQLKRYSPELEHEKSEFADILGLAHTRTPMHADDMTAEVERLRALEAISATLAVESLDMARRAIERCGSLLLGTARVIRRFLASARDNEILILNLLQNKALVEKVYGEGAAEEIFAELCAQTGPNQGTGTECALRFVRERCCNLSALEPGTAS